MACMEVLMSYSHNWFQIEVDFATHSFASPQPVEKTPPRVNILNPRFHLKMVAVVTVPPRAGEGFLLILKPAEAVSTETLLLPLLSFPE